MIYLREKLSSFVLTFVCIFVCSLGAVVLPTVGHAASTTQLLAMKYTHANAKETTGSIVMIDTILKALAANENDTITQLELFNTQGGLVLTLTGCYLSVCSYDLSNVSSGTYRAVVTLNTGATFSKVIQL